MMRPCKSTTCAYTYLELLAQCGQLMRIQQPVSLIHEAADIAVTCERTGGPAPLLDHIYLPDDSGQPKPFTSWRLFASALANQERVALVLGCDKAQVIKVIAYALDPANAISPAQMRDAAWKKNLITDLQAIDVNTLPIPKHAVSDGGRFITGGVVVSKHPETGVGNLSYNRTEILGPRTFGMNINQWRAHAAAEARGRPLGVAVAIGLDPAIMIAAECKYEGDGTTLPARSVVGWLR